MTYKYFEFEDGQRLPGDRVKEFLMNQTVIQCDNQTAITGSGIEELGARVAINLEDGQLWTYTEDIDAWAPAQNTLDLELLDARYYTKIAANGIFISETTADSRYLTEVTARGIFLTATSGDTRYYTKLQADGLFLSETTGDARYYTKLQADGLYMTQTTSDARYYTKLQADGLYLGKQEAGTTYVTKVDAGQIYLSKTDATNTYVTQLNAGTLFISKGGAAGDINGNNTTIDGGKITANSITAGQISSAYIYAGTLNANNITTGTLTGRVVRTSGDAGDQRLSLNTDGRIVFFRAGNAGTPDAEIRAGDTSGNLTIRVPSGSSTGVNIGAGGLTVIGSGNLTAGGDVFAGGSTGAFNLRTTSVRFVNTLNDQSGFTQLGGIVSSDARIKEEVQTSTLGLDFVNDLNPVQFEFIDKEIDMDQGKQFGVIAQELSNTLAAHGVTDTGLVYKSFYGQGEQDFLYSVNHDQLIAPLIKAVQELSARVAALEAQ